MKIETGSASLACLRLFGAECQQVFVRYAAAATLGLALGQPRDGPLGVFVLFFDDRGQLVLHAEVVVHYVGGWDHFRPFPE